MGKREASAEERRWSFIIATPAGPPGTAKRFILECLFRLRMAGKDERVVVSVDYLMGMTGLGERALRKHLKELEALGWFRRWSIGPASGKQWRRYAYRIEFPKGFDKAADPWLTWQAQHRQQALEEYRAENGWQQDEPQEGEYLPRGDPDEIDLTRIAEQPPPQPEPRPAAPEPPYWYSDPGFREVDPRAWQAYVHYRTGIRREPLSYDAAYLAANALLTYRTAAEQMEAVQATISRGHKRIEKRYPRK